jgi:hypothetical protein
LRLESRRSYAGKIGKNFEDAWRENKNKAEKVDGVEGKKGMGASEPGQRSKSHCVMPSEERTVARK